MLCRKVILRKCSHEMLSFEEKLSVAEALGLSLGTLDIWSNDYGAYGFVQHYITQQDRAKALQEEILTELSRSLGRDLTVVADEYQAIYD